MLYKTIVDTKKKALIMGLCNKKQKLFNHLQNDIFPKPTKIKTNRQNSNSSDESLISDEITANNSSKIKFTINEEKIDKLTLASQDNYHPSVSMNSIQKSLTHTSTSSSCNNNYRDTNDAQNLKMHSNDISFGKNIFNIPYSLKSDVDPKFCEKFFKRIE